MEEGTCSKRGWRGRGGGEGIFKIVIARVGGTIFICNYFFFWGGGGKVFHTPHFSENPAPALGRNKRTANGP